MTFAALMIAVVAVLLAGVALMQLRVLRLRLRAVPKDGDVIGMLRELDVDLAAAEKALADLGPRLEAVERMVPTAVAHVGVVNYNAFGDITGNMSRSVALLDRRGNGLVISVLVGRAETMFFTKRVQGRQGVEELSPEEQAAISQAMAG